MGPATRGSPATTCGSRRFLADLRTVAAPRSAAAAAASARSGGAAPGSAAGAGAAGLRADRALVELAQRGDAEAFGMLYERYVDVVYRYVYVRVGNQQLAEDLTSRDVPAGAAPDRLVLLAGPRHRGLVHHHRPQPHHRQRQVGPLPHRGDHGRHARRRPAGRWTPPTRRCSTGCATSGCSTAVKNLKPEQAECVVLRFLQGLSLAETAKVLGKSEGAVKQLQLRAVRSLHRELADVAL